MSDSFGSYLKQERELRKISLEELSEQTHIKSEYLAAMESDHFEKLPGLTFAKGYIKAYAGYIGLGEEDVLLRFEEYLKKLSGSKGLKVGGDSLPRFWLVTFLLLIAVATFILLWFRK